MPIVCCVIHVAAHPPFPLPCSFQNLPTSDHRRVLPNLQLLQTLCTEHVVLDLLREGKLGLRSASIISLILQTLYGEEAAEYAVVDPPSWGIEKVISLCMRPRFRRLPRLLLFLRCPIKLSPKFFLV